MESKTEYLLTNEAVDEISEKTSEFLGTLNTESKNLLRIRLLVEEILLDWQEHFSEQAKCQVRIGKRFSQPLSSWKSRGKPITLWIKTRKNSASTATGFWPTWVCRRCFPMKVGETKSPLS